MKAIIVGAFLIFGTFSHQTVNAAQALNGRLDPKTSYACVSDGNGAARFVLIQKIEDDQFKDFHMKVVDINHPLEDVFFGVVSEQVGTAAPKTVQYSSAQNDFTLTITLVPDGYSSSLHLDYPATLSEHGSVVASLNCEDENSPTADHMPVQ